jgi:hypothetical protein
MNKFPKPIPKLGLYPYSYAVEDIAKQMGFSDGPKMSLLLEMAGAIRKGELQVRSSETGAPFAVTPNMNNPSPYVTIDDINRWLGERGFTYRWTRQADHGTGLIDDLIQSNADTHDQESDVSQSNLTGLTKAAILAADWPGAINLNAVLSDIPQWLESARVMRGKRGRNGSTLWNPSLIAVCLMTEKGVQKNALTRHLKTWFPDFLPQWEAAIDTFNTGK